MNAILSTRRTPLPFACVWLTIMLVFFAGQGSEGQARAAADPVKVIHFARGASSAQVRGAAVRGERVIYSFEAREGQHATIRIDALGNNGAFQIYTPPSNPVMNDSVLEVIGQTLPGAGETDDATRWTGTLPRSGAYLVVVGSTRGNVTYRLTVAID
jgi:hypothetical protein